MSEEKELAAAGSGKKKIGGVIVAIILGLLYFLNGGEPSTNGDITENVEDEMVYNGLENYLPTSTTEQLIKYPYYTISYSEKHKQAEWVAYKLTRDMVLKATAERGHLTFKKDTSLASNKAVKSSDYTRSGYDRGHLVPAQDMAFSATAMKETFFMSNVSPQDKDFNRGKWKELENQTRTWASENDEIYVIAGPVLTKRAIKRFPKAKKAIPVPHSYFKIILDFTGKEDEVKAIAFWLRNQETDIPLSGFVTTIDEIEELTGIDFFPGLPNDIEDKLESRARIDDWNMTQDAYGASFDPAKVKEFLEEEN
jgi:endonuclease G